MWDFPEIAGLALMRWRPTTTRSGFIECACLARERQSLAYELRCCEMPYFSMR